MKTNYNLNFIWIILFFLASCGPKSNSSTPPSSSSNIPSSSQTSNIEVDENAPSYEGMEFLDIISEAGSPNTKLRSAQQPNKVSDFYHQQKIDNVLPEEDLFPLDYYGMPDAEVFVNIYLNNPLRFEILSFTLNDDKYQSFQFLEGSNSNLLILKIRLPAQSGRYEYTIDQIKYVDGTEIKDVRIDGDQIVNVGVTFLSKPIVTIQPIQITKFSLSVTLQVQDSLKQLKDNYSGLKILLIQNNEIVFSSDLTEGNQTVLIDKLPSGTKYQFYIVGLFDILDGKGYQQSFYFDTLVKTNSFLEFYDISVSTNSVNFKLREDDPTNLGSLTKVQIYEGDEFVEEIPANGRSNFEFTELFSDTEYTLKAVYNYRIEGTLNDDVLVEEYFFTTLFFFLPELSFTSVLSTSNSVSFVLSVLDLDAVGFLDKTELFENNTLVATINGASSNIFSTLKSSTRYTIIARYKYDLKDGNGSQILSLSYETTTAASMVSVSNGSVLTTNGSSTSNVGEEIQLRLILANSDNKLVTDIILNGEKYPVLTPNTSIVSIKFVPATFGGQFNMVVTGLVYSHNGIIITQPLTSSFQTAINVLGQLDITNFMMADGKDYVNIRLSNEALAIEIDNPYGFQIFEVIVFYDNREVKYSGSQILMYDETTIFLTWDGPSNAQLYFGEWYSRVEIKSIKYGFSIENSTIQLYEEVYRYFYFVTSDTIQIINTVNDLVNIQSGRYTRINNDLDLGGIGNWIPKDFTGIIEGNGHKISNLSIFVNNNLTSNQTYGLFRNFVGRVDGLIIEFATIDITTFGNVQVGFLAGSSTQTSGIEINEVRVVNSTMNVVTQGVASIGGFGGGLGFGKNSYLNNVNITLISSSSNIGARSYIGGFFKENFKMNNSSGTLLNSGHIEDSYANSLTIDATTSTGLSVGGFTAIGNEKTRLTNLFQSSLTIKISSSSKDIKYGPFSNEDGQRVNLFIGANSTMKLNTNPAVYFNGLNVVDEDLFKGPFIYDVLNWNPLIWTYRGKNVDTMPFLIEPFTIIFFSNGGTSVPAITLDYLSTINTPNNPEKNGYTFGGWYQESTLENEFFFDIMPYDGATLFAKWNLNTYEITYFLDNGENNPNNRFIFTVESETINLQVPTRKGFTFGGWYTSEDFNGEAVTEITMGSVGDITLYAKWIINSYGIEYVLNDGENGDNPTTYTVETETIVLEDASRIGYTFGGWYTSDDFNGEAVTEITMGSVGDIRLYAKWIINSYTISFDSEGGSEVDAITAEYGTNVSEPSEPTRAGYTFDGWYVDAAMTVVYEFTTMGAEDITLYAKWIINSYGIEYVLNDGENGDNPTTYTVETETIVLEDASRIGYTFGGWYTSEDFNGEAVTEITMGSVGDIRLYAKWIINSYTISFDSEGGSEVDAITAEYGTNVSEPSEPTRAGYTFDGWYVDAAMTVVYEFTTMGAEDITLYAKWIINSYGIEYVLNDGENGDNPTTYTVETETIVLEDASRIGYTFGGWYTSEDFNGEAVTEITMGSVGDIRLYAKWIINSYTISFDSEGGSEVDAITAEYGTNVSEPSEPTRAGYTFDGWYVDAAMTVVYEFTTMGAEDITLYAKWIINSYGIEYVLNDGENGDNPTTYTVETETIVLEDASRIGYTFGGWYTSEDFNGEAVTEITMGSVGDIRLYAKWVEIPLED
jgi:uncharacterized repeat protein (TIGR02543 family)